MCLDPVDVVRMNLKSTVSLAPLVESDAEIRERHSVRIPAFSLRSQDADKLRHKVQYLTELCFLCADLFLGGPALGDVGHRSDKLAITGCMLHSVSYREYVLDSPVSQQQAILMFEVNASLGYAIDDLLCEGPIRG